MFNLSYLFSLFKEVKQGGEWFPFFKYVELEDEFKYLLDPRLQAMTLEFAYLSWLEFKKRATITHIKRTQDQQNSFYQDKIDQGYYIMKSGKIYYSANEKTPTISVHQTEPCRGLDLRDRIYTDDEIKFLQEHFNKWFPYGNGKSSLVHHNVQGSHIHLQCPAL